MKTIILIMFSSIMLFKPLWPVVDYVSNYEYIVNVLCENRDKPELKCNGKCYLTKQLAKEAQDTENTPYNSHQNIEIPVILFCESLVNYKLFIIEKNIIEHNFNTSQNLYSKLFVSNTTPPPKPA